MRKAALAVFALHCACAFGEVTRNTEWQDVPDTTKVGTVLDLGGASAITAGMATNIAGRVITNHVNSGYLCTVAAANGRYLKTDGTGTMGGAIRFDNFYGDAITRNGNSVMKIGIEGLPEPNWFLGGCEYASEANSLNFKLYGSMPNGKIYGSEEGDIVFKHRDGWLSPLVPDNSPVMTAGAVSNYFPIVTNAYTKAETEATFAANADYALTNLAANAASVSLASGSIATLVTTGGPLNVSLVLPANVWRSCDAMLRVVNEADVALGISMENVELDGAWPSTIKAGTNLVMFVKTAYNDTASKSVITVTSKEVK